MKSAARLGAVRPPPIRVQSERAPKSSSWARIAHRCGIARSQCAAERIEDSRFSSFGRPARSGGGDRGVVRLHVIRRTPRARSCAVARRRFSGYLISSLLSVASLTSAAAAAGVRPPRAGRAGACQRRRAPSARRRPSRRASPSSQDRLSACLPVPPLLPQRSAVRGPFATRTRRATGAEDGMTTCVTAAAVSARAFASNPRSSQYDSSSGGIASSTWVAGKNPSASAIDSSGLSVPTEPVAATPRRCRSPTEIDMLCAASRRSSDSSSVRK